MKSLLEKYWTDQSEKHLVRKLFDLSYILSKLLYVLSILLINFTFTYVPVWQIGAVNIKY